MQDDRRPKGPGPAGDAARDIEAAERHAERRVRELKEEARREIEATERATRDREEVGEGTPPPGRRER